MFPFQLTDVGRGAPPTADTLVINNCPAISGKRVSRSCEIGGMGVEVVTLQKSVVSAG